MSLWSRLLRKERKLPKRTSTAAALRLLRAVGTSQANRLVSPFSVMQALGMVALGASGQTRAEILTALGWDDKPSRLSPYLASLRQRLESMAEQEGGPTLRAANRVWLDDRMTVAEKYAAQLAKHYGNSVETASFESDPEHAAERVNAWVSDTTGGEIPTLVTSADVSGTLMVLANAIYLAARWEIPFETYLTRDDTFRRLNGDVTIKFMKERNSYRCHHRAGGDALDVVELPYGSCDLALTVIVPRAQPLDTFVKELTAPELDRLVESVELEEIDLLVPRFEIETSLNLADALGHLGMRRAFTEDAEFTRMGRSSSGNPAKVGPVQHKARMRVDESGTVAAAATAVLMGETHGLAPVPPPLRMVKVDQPFLVLIRDTKTGSILFLGEIYEPIQCPPGQADDDSSEAWLFDMNDLGGEDSEPRVIYSLDELDSPPVGDEHSIDSPSVPAYEAYRIEATPEGYTVIGTRDGMDVDLNAEGEPSNDLDTLRRLMETFDARFWWSDEQRKLLLREWVALSHDNDAIVRYIGLHDWTVSPFETTAGARWLLVHYTAEQLQYFVDAKRITGRALDAYEANRASDDDATRENAFKALCLATGIWHHSSVPAEILAGAREHIGLGEDEPVTWGW